MGVIRQVFSLLLGPLHEQVDSLIFRLSHLVIAGETESSIGCYYAHLTEHLSGSSTSLVQIGSLWLDPFPVMPGNAPNTSLLAAKAVSSLSFQYYGVA